MIIEQLKTLVEMQKLDDQIGRYRILQLELPKQLSEIVDRVEQATATLLAVETEKAELNKKQRAMEGDIKQHGDQARKYATQLSEIKTNKEYKALNSEIAYLKEKISELESQEIELMDLETEIKVRVDEAKKELAPLKKPNAIRKANCALRSTAWKPRSKRPAPSATNWPPPCQTRYIKQYGNMIKNKTNVAVAWNKDGSCGACGFVIRPQIRIELQLFKRLIPCENCGRILIDSSLENQGNEEEASN
jgi:predicted  nucleic acid-binding Zn-ribbon protein